MALTRADSVPEVPDSDFETDGGPNEARCDSACTPRQSLATSRDPLSSARRPSASLEAKSPTGGAGYDGATAAMAPEEKRRSSTRSKGTVTRSTPARRPNNLTSSSATTHCNAALAAALVVVPPLGRHRSLPRLSPTPPRRADDASMSGAR